MLGNTCSFQRTAMSAPYHVTHMTTKMMIPQTQMGHDTKVWYSLSVSKYMRCARPLPRAMARSVASTSERSPIVRLRIALPLTHPMA